MAALASDWLRHFQLLLWNRWMDFYATWQEARSQHPLPRLSVPGWSVNKKGCPGQFLLKGACYTQVRDMWPFWSLVLVFNKSLICMCDVPFSHPCHLHYRDYGKLYSLSSRSPIRHYHQALSRAKSNGWRRCSSVGRHHGHCLIKSYHLMSCWTSTCYACWFYAHHRIPLTHSMFVFGTIENVPSIIRTSCKYKCTFFGQ